MKRCLRVMVGLLVLASSWADEPPLFSGQTSLLDRIFALTETSRQTGAVAVELLELVALGRTSSITSDKERQVGLPPGILRQPAFAEPIVRVYALRKIGECALPEALEFLKNLKRVDLGEDTTQMLWPNARVALNNALLSRIPEEHAKIQFLVDTLTEAGDGQFWAADLLCDHGISSALPLIRVLLRRAWSGQRGEEAIAFCESRIQVLSRYPDRIRALSSILTADSPAADGLLQWAVYQLDSMHSHVADVELDRFATEIASFRDGTPENRRFWMLKTELRRILEKRRR